MLSINIPRPQFDYGEHLAYSLPIGNPWPLVCLVRPLDPLLVYWDKIAIACLLGFLLGPLGFKLIY